MEEDEERSAGCGWRQRVSPWWCGAARRELGATEVRLRSGRRGRGEGNRTIFVEEGKTEFWAKMGPFFLWAFDELTDCRAKVFFFFALLLSLTHCLI